MVKLRRGKLVSLALAPALTGVVLCWAAGARSAATDWSEIEKEAVALLGELVRIDTTNPPADVTKAVEFLEGVLSREGMEFRRYSPDAAKGRHNLLVKLRGRGEGKALLMLAHIDVVPATDSLWKVPPFSARIVKGEMWGRGTLDMKGQGIVELMSMIALKRAGIVPNRDVLLLFTCDEETGGEMGAGWMAQNKFDDLDPAFVLDEGSSGSRGIYTDDGRTVFGVSVAEKRVLWLKLTAHGEGGHGSMPGPRVAGEKLARAITRVAELKPAPRETGVLREMRRRLGKLADNRIIRALERTTITVTALRAGVGEPPSVNVIPGEASALIDCRLLPGDSAKEMISRIRKDVGDPDIDLDVIHMPEEVKSASFDTGLCRAIEKVVVRHVPGSLTVPVMLTGGTDARYFRARGVNAYGFEPFVRTAEEEELIHGDNERINIKDFQRALRIYHDLLSEFLK